MLDPQHPDAGYVYAAAGGLLLLFFPRRDRDIRHLRAGHFAADFCRCRCICPRTSIASQTGFQFESEHAMDSDPNIHYHLGMDGISMWLVVLTTFLTPLCVLISWKSIHERVKEFFILLLVLETALIGVFVALDLFLFYFFWEATLIPMALLIGMFGHGRRVYAAVKFFLYTMIASVFMLAGMLWLYAQDRQLRFCRPFRMRSRTARCPISRPRRNGSSWDSLSRSP